MRGKKEGTDNGVADELRDKEWVSGSIFSSLNPYKRVQEGDRDKGNNSVKSLDLEGKIAAAMAAKVKSYAEAYTVCVLFVLCQQQREDHFCKDGSSKVRLLCRGTCCVCVVPCARHVRYVCCLVCKSYAACVLSC